MSDNSVKGICQLQNCDIEVTAEFEYYSLIIGRILCFGYCKDHIKMMFQSCKDVGRNPKMRPPLREKVVFT